LSGTLKVYSHARSGNKLDGSYKILQQRGGYVVATFRDGVIDGSWERYSSQRILLEQSNFVDGRPDGESRYFTSTGKLKNIEIYDQGVPNGVCKRFSRNGNVIEATTHKDGIKVLVEAFYDSGNPKRIEPYVDNLKHGIWKTFYPDGTLEAEHTYEHDVQTGPSTEYFRSGQKKVSGLIGKTGYRQGKWLSYYDSGQLRTENYYEDGRVIGPERSFYENGEKKQACKLNQQRSDGSCKLFDDVGRLLKKWELAHHKRHGKYQEFFDNGSKKYVYNYANGKKQAPKKPTLTAVYWCGWKPTAIKSTSTADFRWMALTRHFTQTAIRKHKAAIPAVKSTGCGESTQTVG
jgi:antitoxin component YwqK of YwqJK toxin-antitoxin module